MFGNKDLYRFIWFVELAMGSPTGRKAKSLKVMTQFSRKNVFFGCLFLSQTSYYSISYKGAYRCFVILLLF